MTHCETWHLIWGLVGLGVGLLAVPVARLVRIVRVWRRAGR